jgi:NADPH:quinone reductase-like Zn-dependent oxidoreductase
LCIRDRVAAVPVPIALLLNSIGLALMMIMTPFLGARSDRIGRKTVLLIGAAGLILAAVPLLGWMGHGTVLSIVTGHPTAERWAFLGNRRWNVRRDRRNERVLRPTQKGAVLGPARGSNRGVASRPTDQPGVCGSAWKGRATRGICGPTRNGG